MTALIIDIFGYHPKTKPPPTEPAVVLVLPIVAQPHECCEMGCDRPGTVAIDLYGEGGHGLGGFAGTKFFCEKHEPTFPEDQG